MYLSNLFLSSQLMLQNTATTSLQRVKIPNTNNCPGYDIKPFDGEAPVMLDCAKVGQRRVSEAFKSNNFTEHL